MTAPVLILHGLMMGRPAMLPLAHRLRHYGFAPKFFGYSSLWQSPDKAVERLATVLSAYGDQPVHLVAHSLGGLVAVETLNRYSTLRIGRVVCLGSPLLGSAAARGLFEWHLGFVTGKSGALLCNGLTQLLSKQAEVGMIAGSHSIGLGKYFGCFDGPNDGTVAVSETQWPGLSEQIVVAVTHTGIIYSALVAELTAHFLKTGNFPARAAPPL